MSDLLFTSTEDLERRVRSKDPDASWEAARITPAHSRELLDFILLALANRDMTDDQLYDAYRADGGTRTPQRLRTARAELSNPKRGPRQIHEAAEPGRSAAGNRARRWSLNPPPPRQGSAA